MPRLESVYKKLHAKGYEMVAIDVGDENSEVDKVWNKEKLTMPVAYKDDKLREQYQAITPTNYLIVPDGKIAKAKIAFDEAELTKSLAELGVK